MTVYYIWSEWRDSNSRPLEPHSSTLPPALHPDGVFLFSLKNARLILLHKPAFVKNFFKQVRIWKKKRKVFYLTANFFERRTINALRRWHQRAIRSTTQLSLQPLSTDLPNSVLTQICERFFFQDSACHLPICTFLIFTAIKNQEPTYRKIAVKPEPGSWQSILSVVF